MRVCAYPRYTPLFGLAVGRPRQRPGVAPCHNTGDSCLRPRVSMDHISWEVLRASGRRCRRRADGANHRGRRRGRCWAPARRVWKAVEGLRISQCVAPVSDMTGRSTSLCLADLILPTEVSRSQGDYLPHLALQT